jgi:Zn-dependent protease with chaperone function
MLADFPGSTVLAAALALTPAVLRWWWGRSLARLVDDPVLTERLAAHRGRTTKSVAIAAFLLALGWSSSLIWTLPTLMLSCSLASYDLRRVVYGETWSRWAYLSFFTRLLVALFGFWILLVAMPAIALASGSWSWIVAALLAIVLAAWNAYNADLIRWLIESRPIEDPALTSRFTALAEKCETGMPRFEWVDLKGGVIANAIALPALSRSNVIFTDVLLSRLTADETVAICAHELAHLEYYNPRRLRRLELETYALIAGGVALVPVSRIALDSSLLTTAAWCCIVVCAMAWRVRDRQKHETDSDMRAVALTADAEALATGLTKLHAYAHVPRRLDAAAERQATHPSLARRIRDIRAAAATAPPPLQTDTGFRSADGKLEVKFSEERLDWHEGNAAVHALSYGHLTEVRLDVRPSGPARLLVVERAGRRWEMLLQENDVARAQAVLDVVDGRLSNPVAPANPWGGADRWLLVLAATVALAATQIAAAIVAFLAMIKPRPPVVAATGAASLIAAGLSLRDPAFPGADIEPLMTLLLTLVGIALCWNAWTTRSDEESRGSVPLVMVLGGLAALVCLATLGEGFEAVRLHQATRAFPGAAIFPAALAGALICFRGASARLSAVATFIVGIAAALTGSTQFLDRFGRDPLLLPSEPIQQVHLGRTHDVEFALPFYATDVRLSPGGARLAALAVNASETDDSLTFHVGRPGEPLSPIIADDFVFLDDSRALVIRPEDAGTELRELSLDPKPAIAWRVSIADVHRARLSIRPGTSRWRLLGWNRERHIVRVEGNVGEPEVARTEWRASEAVSRWPRAIATSAHSALVVETRYEGGPFDGGSLLPWALLLHSGNSVSELWRIGQDDRTPLGISRIETQCFADALGDDRLVCGAFDGTRTRIVALDPATGRISAIGALSGRFASYGRSGTGWLTGWCDSTPSAIRLRTREVIRLERGEAGLVGLAATDRWVGAVSSDGSGSTVRLYPLDAVQRVQLDR